MTARGQNVSRARAGPDKREEFNCQDKTLLNRREGLSLTAKIYVLTAAGFISGRPCRGW